MESDNLKSSSKPINADANSLGNAPVMSGSSGDMQKTTLAKDGVGAAGVV